MPMPRTFSLSHLVLLTTLAGIICAGATYLPEIEFWLFFAAVLTPAILMTIALSAFSRHRGIMIFNALVGAVYGFALNPFSMHFSSCCLLGFSELLIVLPPIIGSLLTGGSYLLAERFESTSKHNHHAA